MTGSSRPRCAWPSALRRFYVRVRVGLRRGQLPVLVRDHGRTTVRADRHPPALLSLAVHRGLQLGPLRTRCLRNSLVLYGLLREQGDKAE